MNQHSQQRQWRRWARWARWARWHSVALVAVLMMTLTTAVQADSQAAANPAKAVIRIGVHNFPPEFFMQQHAGEPARCGGPGVEQTARILATAQLTLEAVCVTPARMYLLLQSGEIDLSINIKSTRALQQAKALPAHQFASPAYMNLQLMLYSHHRRSQAPANDSIAAIRGFDYLGQRQLLSARGFTFMDVSDATSAIELFLHFRTEHLISYSAPFDSYLTNRDLAANNHPQPAGESKPAVEPTPWHSNQLATVPAFYVISAKSPQRDLLRQTIENYAKTHGCQQLSNCR